jgi:uncharacterized protein YvpB
MKEDKLISSGKDVLAIITMISLYMFIVFGSLTLGCSDVPIDETPSDKMRPEAVVAKGDTSATVGTSCAPGCIWSGYAVSVEAQEATNDCAGIPCVCVEDGNVWVACENPEEQTEPIESDPPVDVSDVPYFFQYDNALYPGSSCQNTSVAMVLAHLGWSGRPDDITASWGKDYAQRPHNLSHMFNAIATEEGLGGALQTTTNGTLEGLRSTLQEGYIVIIHGYFTSYGHVLVVTGYDGSFYTTNDPAGVWRQTFRGGYAWSSSTAGHGIRYPKEAFETAVATSNGQNSLPLWYHILRRF